MTWFKLIATEFKTIFSNITIILTVFGGGLFYSFLYPQPYINQIPTQQKIVLIDKDNSTLSRRFAFLVNASSQISIVKRASNTKEIEKSILNEDIMGYLLIPEDFSKDILLKKSPTIAFGADASYFLVYATVAENIFQIVQAIDKKISIKYDFIDGQKMVHFAKDEVPVKINAVPIYNTNIGYVNYVLPAVFILILHQLMMLGVGLLGASQTERKKGYWQKVSPLKLIFTRFLCFYVLYFPLCMYYIGICFEYYGVSHFANINELIILITLFIFAASMLGMFLGELIPRQELVTLTVVMSSLPLVFSAGFIWPEYSIANWVHVIVEFYPTTPSIIAFLKLNQMGASFSQILHELLHVSLLGVVYFLLSYFIIRHKYLKNR